MIVSIIEYHSVIHTRLVGLEWRTAGADVCGLDNILIVHSPAVHQQ